LAESEYNFVQQSVRPQDDSRESRLLANRAEIGRRALELEAAHQRLRLEVETKGVSLGGVGLDEADFAALKGYVERKIAADRKIAEGFSDPAHPYWEYKCATYGAGSFNKRLIVPERIYELFPDAFSGCFCTRHKTHMIDGFKEPGDLASKLSQARRIGHPYELAFILEGQEGALKGLRDADILKDTRVVVWMIPIISEPPAEARKESIRRDYGVNALDSSDLGALFMPPEKGAGLRQSLTGQDMWLEQVFSGKTVRIDYEEKRYQPPYRLRA
jgi:hypothetical protein